MEWTQDREVRASLAHFNGFGSRSLRKLFAYFPKSEDIWISPLSHLLQAGLTQNQAEQFIEWRKTVHIDQLIERLEHEQIRVLLSDDADFPQALKLSADSPEVLFVRGKLSTMPAISIVGTRRMTSYGKRCLQIILPDLVKAGFAIVSGLALGIDAYAHELTLENQGIAVVFLGSGIDQAALYPRANARLGQRILEQGGVLLSEFPPGTEGRPYHFPLRNRLIASYSLATLVVEASAKSGSLITAKAALEENKEVLTIPGPIWNETSAGCHQLLKAGAKICTSAQDLLEVLQIDTPQLMAQAQTLLPLDSLEKQIMDYLNEPRHIDELIRQTQSESQQVSSKLALLELKGLVKRIEGQHWLKSSIRLD